MIQGSQQHDGDFLEILSEVKRQAECDFVQRFVEIPAIPLPRMRILFLFLQEAGVPMDKIKAYLVPTILIQMALDCHDEVTLLPQTTERGIRERQLSVLAGDYYSSKYYFLLSKLDDISLINHLSEAISEINELKTRLYATEKMGVALSFYVQHQIDASLYLSFYSRFGRSSEWKEIIGKVIEIERFIADLEQMNERGELPNCLRYRSYSVDAEEVRAMLHEKSEEGLEQLYTLIAFAERENVRVAMAQLMDSFRQRANHLLRVSDGLKRGV